jgi:hypothetical protein
VALVDYHRLALLEWAWLRQGAFRSIGIAYLFPSAPRFQTAPAPHIIRHRLGLAKWSWTMTILVTGSTGTIGSQVVQRLAGQSIQTRALVRDDASKVKVGHFLRRPLLFMIRRIGLPTRSCCPTMRWSGYGHIHPGCSRISDILDQALFQRDAAMGRATKASARKPAIYWRRSLAASPKDLAPPICERARNFSTS